MGSRVESSFLTLNFLSNLVADDSLRSDSELIGGRSLTAKLHFQQLLDYTLEQMMVYRSGHPASPSKVAFAAQAFALFKDNDFDSLAVAGAIGSAIEELQSSIPTTSTDGFDRTELCTWLVRIAYNRMQRRQRSDAKLAHAVSHSKLLDANARVNREISSFHEHIGEVVDIVLGQMPEIERQAVLLRLNGETQIAAAQQLAISRAAVQRIERRFAEIVTRTMNS